MIDVQKCVEALQAVYPEKNAGVARVLLTDLVERVRAAEVEQGDYYFNASYGFHVQKNWYEDEPECSPLEVSITIADDGDILGEDLV